MSGKSFGKRGRFRANLDAQPQADSTRGTGASSRLSEKERRR